MNIKKFKQISEKDVLARKRAFKSLIEEEPDEIYENERGKILIGENGIFYENKLFPNRDYTYSNKYHKKFLTDDEVKNMIKKLQELRTKINQNNSVFFYYGFMYKDGESYELSYNFHRNEKEELGELREEIPEVIKIKIYSDIETIFDNNIKNGIIVILRLPEKNILAEVSHEEGDLITQL